jgi:UDP-GlcNAc:undecaprenyl-phosphate GlcNAc-1-phosphate transferase
MVIPAILTSFAISLGLGGVVLKVFPKLGLMDRPKKYGHKRDPIPYPGGVAPFLAIMTSLLIFLPLEGPLLAVLTGGALLGLTSFVDDRRGLSPFLRLGVQFLAGTLLVVGGVGIMSISNPLGGTIVLDQWSWNLSLGQLSFTLTLLADLVTVLWVMVMINAFNWIDGVPGMTSSVSAVAALILLLLSVRPDFHYIDQTLAITLSSVILGASLAFLIFDFPPPRMLMGDTGSMLLGFFLAVTAIISGGKIATTILILGFPILDFIWVILRRLIRGQSPFRGDLWHFHHRFLKAGLSPRQVVIFFSGTAAVFGGLSLFLHTEGKALAFAGIISVMLVLSGTLYKKM